jgi:Ca2+-transporting ATPase
MGRPFWEQKGLKKIGEYAFDSDRKLMSVIYSNSKPNDTLSFSNLILVKGAPEALLSQCTTYLPPTSKTITDLETLDGTYANTILSHSSVMASRGLRVLGLGMRNLTNSDPSPDTILAAKNPNEAEKKLTFVGLIGLIDPPRKGVKESVEKCKKAGIKVIMITGDHIVTATAIATSLSILNPADPRDNRAIKGAELDLLAEEELKALDPFPSVFARVRYNFKVSLITH